MAAVAAWDCPDCGGLRFSSEGSTNPVFDDMTHYTKPHVCRRNAEREYAANPRLSLDDEFEPGVTYAEAIGG